MSRLSYRDVLAEYQLILCDNPGTCRRAYSVNAHQVGTADTMGHIHWSRADRKVTRRGLRQLLTLVATVQLKHATRKIPTWQRLYEMNRWAWEEGMRRWHVAFTQDMSKADRIRAYRLGGSEARSKNFAAYQWMRGRNKRWVDTTPSTTKNS